MAVTRQLARLKVDLLDQCKLDVSRLDELCSFRLLSSNEYLDLDWSSASLARAAFAAKVPEDVRSRLDLATDGQTELNPDYRSSITIWQHPVMYNPVDLVIRLHHTLQSLDDQGFPDPAVAREAMTTLTVDFPLAAAADYLRGHFLALHHFYLGAAARELSVAMWWD